MNYINRSFIFVKSVVSDILRNPCEGDLQGLCKCAPPPGRDLAAAQCGIQFYASQRRLYQHIYA